MTLMGSSGWRRGLGRASEKIKSLFEVKAEYT
jgi:hypothetical protein